MTNFEMIKNMDIEVCNNCGMKQADELFERDKEIERLEAENKRLSGKLGQILLSIDTVKEMNAICNIDSKGSKPSKSLRNGQKTISPMFRFATKKHITYFAIW